MKIYTKEELEERNKQKQVIAKQIIKQMDKCHTMLDKVLDKLNKDDK